MTNSAMQAKFNPFKPATRHESACWGLSSYPYPGFLHCGLRFAHHDRPQTRQDIALMRQNLNPFLVEDDD